MTVIAIRDGIMAVDSLCSMGNILAGDTKKWFAVKPDHGGGFVAFAGRVSGAAEVEAFALFGKDIADKEVQAVHLCDNGEVRFNDGGGWYRMNSDFYASGSGMDIAIGAMAMDATSEAAVKVACKYDKNCGGEIHVLSVRP